MNQSEREMLEMAAKACGYTPDGPFGCGLLVVVNVGQSDQRAFGFDPRNDDGDCARMEAALGIDVEWHPNFVICHKSNPTVVGVCRIHDGDKQEARRIASLSVAVEIGRSMQ